MPKFTVGKKAKEKKYPVGINEDFVKEVESADTETLKNDIFKYQKGIGEAQAFLKCDEKQLSDDEYAGARKLQELKAAYDEAAFSTREAIRALKNKTKYVLDELKKDGR